MVGFIFQFCSIISNIILISSKNKSVLPQICPDKCISVSEPHELSL